MPIGIIINVLSVAIGGLLGAVGGRLLSQPFKDNLQMIFGGCSIGMGVYMLCRMENLTPFVVAVVCGTAIGLLLHIGRAVHAGAVKMETVMNRLITSGGDSSPEKTEMLITVIIIFCVSGTGIYGSIISGMTGDHSILISKSVLDLFTAVIFAADLGAAVALIAVPQCAVFMTMFLLAGEIYPLCTEYMINDFKAVGGFIMLTSGFRMLKLKQFPTAEMLPAMVLIMPCSWFWVTVLLPLIS